MRIQPSHRVSGLVPVPVPVPAPEARLLVEIDKMTAKLASVWEKEEEEHME